MHVIFQYPLCTNETEKKCIEYIQNSNYGNCQFPCNGIYADVKKNKIEASDETGIQLLKESYQKWFLKEHDNAPFNLMVTNSYPPDFVYKEDIFEPNLQFVRIYFDTPKFDRVIKDRKVKFVDMLSAVGGTIGLLTGFSIISGVEILYFAAKIVRSIITKYR